MHIYTYSVRNHLNIEVLWLSSRVLPGCSCGRVGGESARADSTEHVHLIRKSGCGNVLTCVHVYTTSAIDAVVHVSSSIIVVYNVNVHAHHV